MKLPKMQVCVFSSMSVRTSRRLMFGATENCHRLKLRKKFLGASHAITFARRRPKSSESAAQGSVWSVSASHNSLTPEHQSGKSAIFQLFSQGLTHFLQDFCCIYHLPDIQLLCYPGKSWCLYAQITWFQISACDVTSLNLKWQDVMDKFDPPKFTTSHEKGEGRTSEKNTKQSAKRFIPH